MSHPGHLRLLVAQGARLPRDVQLVTSTAPCPDELATAVAALGAQRLVQVYGSSETAGVGRRETPGAPFELLPHLVRQDDTVALAGGHAPLPLQDRLRWHGPRHFVLDGRLDAAVQVAGHNVFPAQVRQLLLEHPGVQDARVRLMAPHEGERLKAFVVPAADADPAMLPVELQALVRQRLPAIARPRAFTLGATLPVDARGKDCDWPLAPMHV